MIYQAGGGGGGGFLGTLGKIAQIGAMFVPGLQPIAAGLNAVNAAANGDPLGAVINGVGLVKGMGAAPKPQGASFANTFDRYRSDPGLYGIGNPVERSYYMHSRRGVY